jgi:hypothetical protein
VEQKRETRKDKAKGKRDDKMRKYTVTLKNVWKRPYYFKKDGERCLCTDLSSYETMDLGMCKDIVKDLLDVPVAEMSIEEVRKQFEDPAYKQLSEEKLVSIQSYYNGRLALFRTLMQQLEMLDTVDLVSVRKGVPDLPDPVILKHDIPRSYNCFYVEDDDDGSEEQVEAYIEVKIEDV